MSASPDSDEAPRIRIAVVDDHPLFREGVAAILARNPGFEVVAQGSNAEHAIRIAHDLLPDILLLDVAMPGDGMDAMRRIAQQCPFVKIVMLTASEDEQHVSSALEAGARGYVLKGIGTSDLLSTLNAVYAGDSYVTPQLAARVLALMKKKPEHTESTLPSLTPREEEILDRVSAGRTNKEIARDLALSEKTIKHYMTNIMHKLQVRNRVEAALATRRKTQ